MLPVLLFQQHMDQYGGEIFRNGGVLPPGGLTQLVQRHKAHGNVERIERFGGAGVGIGLGHPPQAQRVVSGVSDVGILQLLLPGRFVQIQHAVSGGDIRAGLPQVFRQQRPEEHHGPCAVGQGVEHFDGDAAAIVVKPHQPAVVLPKPDGLAGVGDVLLQKRSGRMVRLEIVPEQALADAHGKAREARHTAVDGALERGGIDLPFHPGGEAVDGGILLLLQRGVENARAVELVPFAVGSRHRRFLLPRGIASDGLL